MKHTLFSALPLTQEIQDAISEMGFIQATQIQSETIPLLLEGKDVVGQAQTGTGKTAAFGIPMLEKITPEEKNVTSVVMCPTRELAIQVANELRKIARHKKHIHILPIYGGESIHTQIKELKRHNQVIVGTPGRIIDHLERKTLSFDKVNTVVLDEADEMLNMGFRHDIESILKTMPKERQTVLFSATMPKPIIELAKKFQHHPEHIKVTQENLTAASIEQVYFDIGRLSKPTIISALIRMYDMKLAIVFCNTKRKVDEVVKTLKQSGLRVEGIHGDYNQQQRNKVLTAFREGTLNILVATDVAARGIDVNDVDAVFNYDIPLDPEYYVHRIGRTGRAGKEGRSFTFVTGRNDYGLIKDIERFAKITIERRPVPTDQQLRESTGQRLLAKLKSVIAAGSLEEFEQMADRFNSEGIEVKQLAAALLKMSMPSESLASSSMDMEKNSRRHDSQGRHSRSSSEHRHTSDNRNSHHQRDISNESGFEQREKRRLEHQHGRSGKHNPPGQHQGYRDRHEEKKRFVKRKLRRPA